METIIIIPARYKSSRFPGKPLVPLMGRPMVLWVADLCAKALSSKNVIVATDDERIADVVHNAGFKSVMTSKTALTGTDRVAEVARVIDADIYINVQGDEPLVDPKDIQEIIKMKKKHPEEIINAYCPLDESDDPSNVNIPKVIFTQNQQMVYVSRQTLPGFKSKENAPDIYYKQVCIYAFNRKELLAFSDYGRKSKLEQSEDIEILRFLEWNAKIRMVETKRNSLAVDVPEDVLKVELALKKVKM